MREGFEPLERDNDNSDIVDLLKSKKSYLMQRFVKFSYDKRREMRKKMPDGTREPRIKKSTDEIWNREHWTDEVDIANTEFDDLPSNRQAERMAAASVAIDLVLDKIKDWEIRLTTEMIEEMSSIVHDKWLERRELERRELERRGLVQDEVDPILVQPYENLSEDEKEKDRNHIYTAIKIIEEVIKNEKK